MRQTLGSTPSIQLTSYMHVSPSTILRCILLFILQNEGQGLFCFISAHVQCIGSFLEIKAKFLLIHHVPYKKKGHDNAF